MPVCWRRYGGLVIHVVEYLQSAALHYVAPPGFMDLRWNLRHVIELVSILCIGCDGSCGALASAARSGTWPTPMRHVLTAQPIQP